LSTNPLPLRDYQIADLGFHIGAKKSLNTSHPGTGKTPTVCMLAYYHWAKRGKKTIWTMPQSLMRQNRDKLLTFTGFEEDDVEIMDSAHAPLTKKWTGPTKTHQQRVNSLRIFIRDARATGLKTGLSHTTALATAGVIGLCQEEKGLTLKGEVVDLACYNEDESVIFEYVPGPDGKPQKFKGLTIDVEVKDLIAASKAKVFIGTFAFGRNHYDHLLRCHPDIDLFLVDELHMGYKSAESEATESFFAINNHVENFCGMTGSLIDGRLDNAFPAIHAIEPLYYGSQAGFLQQHATFIDSFGRVLGWKNEDKLTEILSRHSVCHTFQEVYGDEPVVFFHEKIEVTPKVRESYDKFHEQAMLELENAEFLDGSQPGVAVIRARQILAHPETMGLAKGERTGKDERLAIFAAEGQKMLLFTSLKPEQVRTYELLTSLGLKGGLINSDVSKPQRDKIDRAFKAGELDFIVASGPTAAVGYDWELADHVIYVSPDYQDVNFIQGYRRASRGTRTTTLRVTSLEYRNTIEGRQYSILTFKSQLANKVDSSRPVLMFT
jgi:hypothetical protein